MVAFQIFWFDVYWYGIFYFVSFLLGYGFFYVMGKKRYFSSFWSLQHVLTHQLDYLLMFLLLGVLIGGRLGYVLIYDLQSFIWDWWSVFAVWNGGMSFIGGIIGVVLMVLLFRMLFKLSWKERLILFDCMLVVVPLGIMLGRLGNFLNQELYGIIFTISGVSEGVVSLLQSLGVLYIYPKIDQALRINTNLLSMIFEGGVLFVLNFSLLMSMLKKKRFCVGKISSYFVLGYGVVRFLLEYLRHDSQAEFIGLFSKSQRFFLLFLVFGIGLLVFSLRGQKEPLE